MREKEKMEIGVMRKEDGNRRYCGKRRDDRRKL